MIMLSRIFAKITDSWHNGGHSFRRWHIVSAFNIDAAILTFEVLSFLVYYRGVSAVKLNVGSF